MSGLVARLLAVQGPLLYALVAAVVFVEDALFVGFVGFVVPGETAAVLGGVAASPGHASLPGDDGERGGGVRRRHGGLRGDVTSGLGWWIAGCCARVGSGWAGPGSCWPGAVARRCSWAGSWRSSGRSCPPWPAPPGCAARSSCVQRRRRHRLGHRGGAARIPGRHLYAAVERTVGRGVALAVAAVVVVGLVVWRVPAHRAEHRGGRRPTG
jgi:hypothetical protein